MAEEVYDQLPSSTRAFDLEAPAESAQALVLELCADAQGCSVHDGSLTVVPVLGGLTNKLFKVTFKCRSVLLRVYGDGGIIDRVAETKQFVALAEAGHGQLELKSVCAHDAALRRAFADTKGLPGIGPACYGRFNNGRLEEFFEGFRTLAAADLGDSLRSRKIAVQLALSHRAIPIRPGEAPSLWRQLDEWLAGAKKASFRASSDAAAEYDSIDLASIESHIQRLAAQIQPCFRVVFCHNDLLAANILEHPGTGDLKLIDFEYGNANYLAFDIGNAPAHLSAAQG